MVKLMTVMKNVALVALMSGALEVEESVVEVSKQQVEAARKHNWEVEMKRKAAKKELYQIEKELGLRSDSVSVKAVPQAVCSRR